MELLMKATKLTGAHDFIMDLPEGYSTQGVNVLVVFRAVTVNVGPGS
jgi:hypothetical protein